MNKLLSAICAAAVIAAGTAAATTPAVAQPARIIVRGATPIYVSPPPTLNSPNSSTNLLAPNNFLYQDPFGFYYDAPGQVRDERYYGPPAVNLALTATLNRTNQSIMGHIQACQARHPTYSAASNTYYGPNGLPVECY
ncbi:MAG TPA: hypothetical protein VL418_11765 [Devosiaceae bacterium]|jgi:hypothetical protein|nr:hypothetical protein [Devosiaceae bacterium]